MSRKMFHAGLGLIVGAAFAGCDDSSSSGGSIPPYTVVQESASDPLTVTPMVAWHSPMSSATISFDGGITPIPIARTGLTRSPTARFSVTGTWDAANSFIQVSAFGTVSGTTVTDSHVVQFYVDDSFLPGGLGVNTLLLLDTTGGAPASGTFFVSDTSGFPTVAQGESFTWSSDFLRDSLTARSWWPNTTDFTANSSGDVGSTAMTAPSGTAAVLSGLSTTVCGASFNAVP